MKDQTEDIAIEKFVGLKAKIYRFLVDDYSENTKANGVNRTVIATISHNQYRNVLLNNICLRDPMNRIQSKGHRIGTYKISKTSMSCFDHKTCIQSNRHYGLDLAYQS